VSSQRDRRSLLVSGKVSLLGHPPIQPRSGLWPLFTRIPNLPLDARQALAQLQDEQNDVGASDVNKP
jgi:hypothetical protein